MKDKVLSIWPEINWIQNKDLREKVLDCWFMQLRILLTPESQVIPLLLIKRL
jgi:hypothetical protein